MLPFRAGVFPERLSAPQMITVPFSKKGAPTDLPAPSLYQTLPVLAEGPADRGVERFGDRAPRPPEGALPL